MSACFRTQQSCDCSQLHGAQAFAWTWKSAIWSRSNNKAGSDAPRANKWIVQRWAARVWSVCIKPRLYLSALVSGLISVTAEPLSTVKSETYDNGGVHDGSRSHTELLRWRTEVPRLWFQKWEDAVQPGLKISVSVFFSSVLGRKNVGVEYENVMELLDNIESLNRMASRPWMQHLWNFNNLILIWENVCVCVCKYHRKFDGRRPDTDSRQYQISLSVSSVPRFFF